MSESEVFEKYVNDHINSNIKITMEIDGKSVSVELKMEQIKEISSIYNIDLISISTSQCFQQFIDGYKKDNNY